MEQSRRNSEQIFGLKLLLLLLLKIIILYTALTDA